MVMSEVVRKEIHVNKEETVHPDEGFNDGSEFKFLCGIEIQTDNKPKRVDLSHLE